MEITSLLHKKREKVKRYQDDNNDLNLANSFSDFQYNIICSMDSKHSQAWTAEFASLDQSDRISLD